ncbi:putative cytochrome P450 133B2 [Pararobbsia alpina]|uniref:cytochrome P450 n=1 Tax=Pararobbsia alpina TaxID=621374 RepID=UPI0039A483C6
MNFADFASPAFYQNPYPYYDQIRRAGALLPVGPRAMIAAHYNVIDALLRDRRMGKTYMQSVRARYGDAATGQPVFQALDRTFLMMNPPTHTRLRTLLMKAFNARQVDTLRELVHATTQELIAPLRAKPTFDLISEFALPLPATIICRLLDIPYAEGAQYAEAASRLVSAFDLSPLDPPSLELANEAARSLETYFHRIVEQRRARPGNDLISALLSVEDEGTTLSDDEIVSNVILLFIAGHETTTNVIGNTLVALFRNPERWAELQAQPSLLKAAMAECLRYDTPVQMTARTAFEDVEVEGATVPAGTVVFLLLGAGNRDAATFSDPDTLDFHRVNPLPSLSFGGGIHYCLGARLAMLEIETALESLIEAFPKMVPVDLDALVWQKRNNVRGVESLRVQHT